MRRNDRNIINGLAFLMAGVALLALAGCGVKQVQITEPLPTPVAAQHDRHVGLYAAPAFANYVYAEELPDGSDWRIELGPANVALFERTLAGLFRQVSPLERARAAGGVEAVFAPEIVDYQFSTPDQNQTDYYEAWIKYRVRFLDAGGEQLAQWPVTAYGRSEKQFLDAEQSLRAATRVALRDAAAALVLGLDSQPAVRAFVTGGDAGGQAVAQER